MGTEFEKTSGARVSVPAPLNRKEFNWGGSEEFVGRTKEGLGIRAKTRKVREMAGQFELREPEASYSGHFKAKKGDIGAENTYFWDDYLEIL